MPSSSFSLSIIEVGCKRLMHLPQVLSVGSLQRDPSQQGVPYRDRRGGLFKEAGIYRFAERRGPHPNIFRGGQQQQPLPRWFGRGKCHGRATFGLSWSK